MSPTDHELSGDYGNQLSFLPGVPVAGETYTDPRLRRIVTVVSVFTGRQVLVTYRLNGMEFELPLERFLGTYRPCRPDGRLL